MNQRAQIFFRACLHILLLLTSLTYWPHFHLLFKKDGLLLMVWGNDCRELQTPFFSQLTTLEGGKPLLILFIHMKSQQSPRLILCFRVYECAQVHTFLFCFKYMVLFFKETFSFYWTNIFTHMLNSACLHSLPLSLLWKFWPRNYLVN